jgi:hypothetical protein
MDSILESQSDFSNLLNDKSNNVLVIFIIILGILIIWLFIRNNNQLNKENKEHMSGGTLTQLFAKDSQDIYLNSNVDKLATGNYSMFWNEPTRVANTFLNRGSPLPTLVLPNIPLKPNQNPYALEVSNNYVDNVLDKKAKKIKTFRNPILLTNDVDKTKQSEQSVQSVKTIPEYVLPSSLPMPSNPLEPPNPFELSKVAKQIAITKNQADNLVAMTELRPIDYLYQTYYDNLLYNKDCLKNPASCGGGAGGFRLGEDFVQATKAKPFVYIGDNVFYPDSYVGSYFSDNLNFDISKPFPFIPK